MTKALYIMLFIVFGDEKNKKLFKWKHCFRCKRL